MEKILIDYESGTHGHFLEFILNALDDPTDALLNSDPFLLSDRGTCRRRIYTPWSLRFCADHYRALYKFEARKQDIESATECIYIRLSPSSPSTITALKVILSRADPNVDLSDFEHMHLDFFNKIKNSMIADRFKSLIKDANLSENSPNLEYHQLRSFFTNYAFNQNHVRYNSRPYYAEKNITDVWFADFYSWPAFLTMILRLSAKFNLNTSNRIDRLQTLHSEFLSRNQFANDNAPDICKQILNNLDSDDPLPTIGLIEQSWICSNLLDNKGGFYYPNNKFFETPRELKKYINDLKNCKDKNESKINQ